MDLAVQEEDDVKADGRTAPPKGNDTRTAGTLREETEMKTETDELSSEKNEEAGGLEENGKEEMDEGGIEDIEDREDLVKTPVSPGPGINSINSSTDSIITNTPEECSTILTSTKTKAKARSRSNMRSATAKEVQIGTNNV